MNARETAARDKALMDKMRVVEFNDESKRYVRKINPKTQTYGVYDRETRKFVPIDEIPDIEADSEYKSPASRRKDAD